MKKKNLRNGIIKGISSFPNAIFYQVKIEILPYSVSTKGYELPSAPYTIWGTAEFKDDDIFLAYFYILLVTYLVG